MYKDLIKLIRSMIVNPGNTWHDLANKFEKDEEFLTRTIYPLIGLITLSAFTGILFTEKDFSFEIALKSAIKALLASLGGFFLSSYTVNELWKAVFRKEDNIRLCRRFVGYSSVVMYTLDILLCLLPMSDFFYLRIVLLYTAYIVWEGVLPYMGIREEDKLFGGSAKMIFTLSVFVIITAFPMMIRGLLFLLMPGLRI
jgi:hypothetical protein